MGADNWAKCPQCQREAEAQYATLQKEAAESYGKVPAESYIAMRERAALPLTLENEFREDYEIGMNDEGTFSVAYSGECSVCTFAFDYKFEQTVDVSKCKPRTKARIRR